MSNSPDAVAMLRDLADADIDGLPSVPAVVSPTTLDEAGVLLRHASDERMPVLIWGAGTNQDRGYEVEAALVITTRRLVGLVDRQIDDLTVVVQAGMSLVDFSAMLAEQRQTAVLPEGGAGGTIGGAIAIGSSGWQRLRYGPIRERVLQTRLVTGDGRVITAGGRVVKNVTGYDIPRLVTGSYGSLGLVGEVCLKLWPVPNFTARVVVEDAEAALATTYRPLAIIETATECSVYLGGAEADVLSQADALGGKPEATVDWPVPLRETYRWSLRVPSGFTGEAVSRVHATGSGSFQAAHGIGEVRFASDAPDRAGLDELRAWAEAAGGALVTIRGRLDGFDPWGSPPLSLSLQHAVKAAFDPVGTMNPGRLPGRL